MHDPKQTVEMAQAAKEDVLAHTETIIDAYLDTLDDIDNKIEFLESLDSALGISCSVVLGEIITTHTRKIREGYTRCQECRKHSKTEEFETQCATETQVECTYTDAGYGDDDCYGDVTYLNTYSICPKCGHKTRTSHKWLRTENERRRSEM